MRTQLTALALAAAALAVPAPAHADHTTFDCVSSGGVSFTPVTGSTYRAVLAGFIVGAPRELVGIRCYVKAGGVEVGTTQYVHGGTAATTAGVVTFRYAFPLELCAEGWDWHVKRTICKPL